MKTNDLSKLPRYGRANAVFVGATEYAGLRPLLVQLPRWLRLQRRLRRAPGYCGKHTYYKFPFTFGQVVLFEETGQLLEFAKDPVHRDLMAWVSEPDGRNATAGFIRLYEARADGIYANGAWSAEA